MSQARVLIVTAVLVGALFLAGAAKLGSPPAVTDSAASVVSWFSAHEHDARFYAWTAAFGSLGFAVVAAIIRGLLPAPERDVFLLGAAGFIIETTVQAWFWAGISLHPGSAAARVVLDIASFWGPLLTGATMTMIGAVTVLGLRSKPLIPAWLTVLGVIVFVEQAIETITIFGTDGFTAPGGTMNLQLGAGLTIIWLLGVVIWAAQQLGRNATAANVPAPAGG